MKLRRRTLNTWVGQIRSGWGAGAAHGAQSLIPLIAHWDPQPNWHQIGVQLATNGHPLHDGLEWLRLLSAALPRRASRSAMHPSVLTAMASGWAAGEMLARTPARDVAPIDVLRMRLRQHFQQAEQLGVDADAHAALVVVDMGAHRDDSTAAAVARHTQEIFNAGETLAGAANGNLIVLTHRDSSLAERTRHLAQIIRDDRSLADSDVRVWVEPIGKSVEHVDAHLLDLAS